MTRTLKATFPAATLAIALAVMSAPAHAGTPISGKTETFEARFSYDAAKSIDENLTIFGRIADKHCRVDDATRNLRLRAAAESCHDDLMDKAVAGIGRTELTAAYTGEPIFTRTVPTAVLSSTVKADAPCKTTRRESQTS